MTDPLGYYLNNSANAHTLIECAVKGGVKHVHLLLDRRRLWRNRPRSPVTEDDAAEPDLALRPLEADGRVDARGHRARAYDFRYVALRYFNVAGADAKGRLGQTSANERDPSH